LISAGYLRIASDCQAPKIYGAETLRIFGMHVDRLLALLVSIELAIFLGVVATIEIATAKLGVANSVPVPMSSAIIAIVLCLLLVATGGYRPEAWRRIYAMFRCILLSGALGCLIALALQAVLAIFADYAVAPPHLIVAGGVALFAVLLFRLLAHWLRSFAQVLKPRVVMLGAGDRAQRVLDVVNRRNRVRLLGLVPEWVRGETPSRPERLLAASPAGLANLARELRVDEIVVALDDRRHRLPIDELLTCRLAGITVLDDASFVERERGLINLTDLSPSWLIFSDGFVTGVVSKAIKRGIDLLLAVIALALVAPLLPIVALAIRLDSAGTVFYRQVRVGRHGRPFAILKFRSMVTDAERSGHAVWAQADDPRITRIGRVLRKFRIDELPQLWNVLAGDMSFVGPRPERPQFVAELAASIPYYEFRHYVRPGLTGWAQINYQYGSSCEDSRIKLEYDLYYLKHRNFVLDMLILLQTVRIVLSGEGAH
jgi:sugar transferase (PEP-CTERM system associated)